MKVSRTLGAIAVSVLAATTSVSAQEFKWDMANEYAANSLHGQAQIKFGEVLAEETDGAIKITNHFSASLGYKSLEQFDAVADGALPIANTNSGQLAGIEPLLLLSSLPFLVRGADDAKMLWETARPYYDKVFEANNQILLYASPWPPAGIWANKPITSVEDLQDLKIRAWDASGVITLKAAGAAPIQLSWADVVPQLATGGIDAVLTSAEGGANSKFWEHLSNFSAVNYSMNLSMTHINADVYNSLSEDQQAAVQKAAQIASDMAWAALGERVAQNYADMEAHDVTVTRKVPDEFLAALAKAGQNVYADWLEKMGPEGQEILDAYNDARGM